MKWFKPVGTLSLGVCLLAALSASSAETAAVSSPTNTVPSLSPGKPGIWKSEVGAGFLSSTKQVSLVAGAGPGLRAFGTKDKHDLALAGLSYGKMWGDVKGEGHWWRGNCEWRAELFGGAQFEPTDDFLVGLSPHLRYNFATGSRLVPFADLGAGVTTTSIGPPDLGGRFQFNLQAGVGLNYFLKDNVALSLESRFLHLSSARISTPNLGVNNCQFLAGVNWFF